MCVGACVLVECFEGTYDIRWDIVANVLLEVDVC